MARKSPSLGFPPSRADGAVPRRDTVRRLTLVRVARQGDTAVVAFARPPVNAFNLALMEELQVRLEELAGDVPRGGLVLTAGGDAFSAGVDFKEVPGHTADQRARMVTHIDAAVTSLYALPRRRWRL